MAALPEACPGYKRVSTRPVGESANGQVYFEQCQTSGLEVAVKYIPLFKVSQAAGPLFRSGAARGRKARCRAAHAR